MFDFSAARKNMVDCQIHPAGVVVSGVLEAFGSVPREHFTPPGLCAVAYNDQNLTFFGEGHAGHFLLAPAVHARMVQAAAPRPQNRVLDIGDAAGYSAAIFALLAGEVVSAANAGYMARAPYDVVFLGGAVAEIPPELLALLAPEGRLVAIVKARGATLGQAVRIRKETQGGFTTDILFDAAAPYLPGFEPHPVFCFG